MAGHDPRNKSLTNQSATRVVTWIKEPTKVRKQTLHRLRHVPRPLGPTWKLPDQSRWPKVGPTGPPTPLVGRSMVFTTDLQLWSEGLWQLPKVGLGCYTNCKCRVKTSLLLPINMRGGLENEHTHLHTISLSPLLELGSSP